MWNVSDSASALKCAPPPKIWCYLRRVLKYFGASFLTTVVAATPDRFRFSITPVKVKVGLG
jgi:hypothetical protein